MGCLSPDLIYFKTVDTEEIIDYEYGSSYVLIPEDFGGGCIKANCYEGNGWFKDFNIYEHVVDWNKDILKYISFKDKDLWHLACTYQSMGVKATERYAKDAFKGRKAYFWKQEIGRALCAEHMNELEYPVRISSKEGSYNEYRNSCKVIVDRANHSAEDNWYAKRKEA